MKIEEVNELSNEAFVRLFGGIYEHSVWVAEGAVAKRPFATLRELKVAMAEVVCTASGEQKLDLLKAHPDLAGRLAQAGELTVESTAEQAAAGLGEADEATIDELNALNTEYRERFGFPFIICARLNNVDSILAAMKERVLHDAEAEFTTALSEVDKIAELRLRDVVDETGE